MTYLVELVRNSSVYRPAWAVRMINRASLPPLFPGHMRLPRRCLVCEMRPHLVAKLWGVKGGRQSALDTSHGVQRAGGLAVVAAPVGSIIIVTCGCHSCY